MKQKGTCFYIMSLNDIIKVDLYDLVIFEETGMNFARILVIVARYVHTVSLSLNIIIMTIQCSTKKMLILSK